MIDVASVMVYLHNGCLNPVRHGDLKPSNVLQDQEMVAHVSDFGIAKFLGAGKTFVQTRTIATIGYIAPVVHDWNRPTSTLEIQSFIGFVGYYNRFDEFLLYYESVDQVDLEECYVPMGLGHVLMQKEKVKAYAFVRLKIHERNYPTDYLDLLMVLLC
ncbi:hypothetical protein MTR67_044234 [Solanum verrucosum]|uniref:Protein kinase domain-containing protein n=1 Tax=Solanum verrucosum TaxID=315347 RepID=A0AAF0UT58_SOLVR|nr:hypothetical protein MTR67_044234 [Solanum verrucosum]